MDGDELRDYLDQDPDIPPTSSADLGPSAAFFKAFLTIPTCPKRSSRELLTLSLSRPGLACGARLQIPVQDFKEIQY